MGGQSRGGWWKGRLATGGADLFVRSRRLAQMRADIPKELDSFDRAEQQCERTGRAEQPACDARSLEQEAET